MTESTPSNHDHKDVQEDKAGHDKKTGHIVCRVSELPPGQRRIIEINGKSIGVFNVQGEYHAIKNVCPHQNARLCEGRICGTSRAESPDNIRWEDEGYIIRCPWHGWEFDIRTGESVYNPHKCKTSEYEIKLLDQPRIPEDINGQMGHQNESVDTYNVRISNSFIVIYL